MQSNSKQFPSTSQSSVRQQSPGMSTGAGATQFSDPRSFTQLHQKGANSPADVSQISSSAVQVQTDSSHPVMDSKVQISREADRQSNSHGMQVTQMSSNAVASTQDRERSGPMQGLNKQQQQQLHYPQPSFSMYGGNAGNYHPYSGTNVNASTLSLKPQPHDSQMRQIHQHQNMSSAQVGGETHSVKVMTVPKLESQNSMSDPSRMQGGSLSHYTNNPPMQHNPVPWQSSTNKDQNAVGSLSSTPYVKQEPNDQGTDQQQKPPLSNSQGLPSVSAAQAETGNASPGTSKDESLEKQPSRVGFSTITNVAPSSSASMAPSNSVASSTTMQLDSNVQVFSNPSSVFFVYSIVNFKSIILLFCISCCELLMHTFLMFLRCRYFVGDDFV